jgi:hypothetical protein
LSYSFETDRAARAHAAAQAGQKELSLAYLGVRQRSAGIGSSGARMEVEGEF